MQLLIEQLGKVAVTVEKDYWSINKDYDKLTIVEVENLYGTFISRKPVPAGTQISNRNYWIRFSNLKEEVVLAFNVLSGRVATAEQTLVYLQQQIDEIKSTDAMYWD